MIPIEQSDPVIKDFAAEVEEGRLNKFSKTLQAKLKKLGLGETGVIVSNDILSTRYIAGTEEILFLTDKNYKKNKPKLNTIRM